MSRKRSVEGREVPSIIQEIVIYDKPNKPLVPQEIFLKSTDFVLGRGDIILTRAKDEPDASNTAKEKRIKSEPLEINEDESGDDEVPKISSSGEHTDEDSSELEESIENISREISKTSTKPFKVPTAKPLKTAVRKTAKLPAKPKKQPKKNKEVASATSKKSTRSLSKQDKDFVFKKPKSQKSILNFVIVQPKDNSMVVNNDTKKGKQQSTVVEEIEMNKTGEDEDYIEQNDIVPEVKETSTTMERQKRARRRPKKYDDDQMILEEQALGHYTNEDVAGPSLKKKKYIELTVVPPDTEQEPVEWEAANTDILDELLEDAQEQVRTLNEVEAELETLVKKAPSSQKSVKTNKKSVRAPARKPAKKPESQINALGTNIKQEEAEAGAPDEEVYASDEDSRTEWVPEEYAQYKQEHVLKLINKFHKCKFCDSEFSSYYSLRKHRALEHDDVGKDRKESTYSAEPEAPDDSSVTFEDSDEESRGEWLPEDYAQYKLKHSIKKTKRAQWYKCKICCLVFSNYYKLSKHRVQHETQPVSYDCKICDAKFDEIDTFTAHIRAHQGKDPYKCKKCGKGFKTKEELIEHLPVHILKKAPPKESRFRCDVCGKEFHKLCDVERHTRVHTGEKPSECNICHKRFQQSHNLSKHLLTHLHVRPFQCEICNKKFGRIDVLNRHLLTHSMQKPYKCTLCNKGFIRQVQLNNHFEKLHPDLSQAGLEAMSNEVSVTPVR